MMAAPALLTKGNSLLNPSPGRMAIRYFASPICFMNVWLSQ